MKTMTLEGRQRFANLIKRLVNEAGSRRAFARSLGVTSSAVIGWEECRSIPEFENLVAISRRSGYSLEELQKMLDGSLVQTFDVDVLIKQIETMPVNQLKVIGRAVSDRLFAIAESTGR